MTLNVLFIVRSTLHAWPGGDTVQIDRTADALRQLGVDVTVSDDPSTDVSAYDLVHLWHLERPHETLLPFRRARARGIPVALSTIYWPGEGAPKVKQPFPRRAAKALLEDLKNAYRLCGGRRSGTWAALRKTWAGSRRELLSSVDVLLPNSQAEAEALAVEGSPRSTRVVPNAVDAAACDRVVEETGSQPRDGIACVGHFDPRKNQLALVEALRDTDIAVTFVGSGRQYRRRYYRRCQQRAGDNMRFLGDLKHRDVLRQLRRCRCHVCPSRFETPGLVNLEAALMGCAIVAPDCAPVREYLRDDAAYFTQPDPDDIRRAVFTALENQPSLQLQTRIREELSWTQAAKATLAAYEAVLGSP